jgi:cullin 3
MGIELFSEVVLHSDQQPIEKRFQNNILQLIRQERDGEIIDRGLVKGLIDMLLALGTHSSSTETGYNKFEIYQNIFEESFLKATGDYYRLESKSFLAENDIPSYLIKVCSITRLFNFDVSDE